MFYETDCSIKVYQRNGSLDSFLSNVKAPLATVSIEEKCVDGLLLYMNVHSIVIYVGTMLIFQLANHCPKIVILVEEEEDITKIMTTLTTWNNPL